MAKYGSDLKTNPVMSKFSDLGSITKNSSFLFFGQMTVTLAGFAFWALAARSESVYEIGIAASLITSSSLVAAISLFGANQAVIKFLPTSKEKNATLRTIISVVGLSSLLLASLSFLLLASAIQFKSSVYWYFAIFVLNSCTVAVNIVIDSAMLSYGKTGRNLLSYLISSSLCLASLTTLSNFGAGGIVAANCILYGGNLVLNFLALRGIGAITMKPLLQMDLVKPYASFVRASYVAGILWVAPILSLPFMALSLVGERLVGYLAMSLTLFNALLQFPSSSSQALFASLSASEVNSGWKVKRAFRDTVLTTICASLALAVLGRAVLELFGEDYAKNGYLVLLLLIPSAVVASANLICNAILKVRGHLGTLMIVNFLGFSVSSLVWVLNLKELGIIAVPFGLILGHAIMLSAHGLIALRRHKS